MVNKRFGGLRRGAALLGVAVLASFLGSSCERGGGEGEPSSREESATKREPGLTLELRPERDRGSMEVTVRVTGAPAASVKELRVARTWAETRAVDVVRDVDVSDARGHLRTGPTHDDGPDRVYPLTRPPVGGELVVRYRASGSLGKAGGGQGLAAPAALQAASRLALRVGSDRASGVGHTFLLLPAIDSPLPTTIRFHLEGLEAGAKGASSFGVGDEVKTVATVEELAHAAYMAGRLNVAEGAVGERMVILGDPELDVGAVLEWTRGVRERARALFQGADGSAGGAAGGAAKGKAGGAPEPFSYLLIAEPRMRGEHDGAHLARSLALFFDEARALDGRLRIAITHEILHTYIGSAVRLDEGGKDAAWFSEGFTTHYARSMLFKERLLSQDDFLLDLERSLRSGPETEEGQGRHEGQRRGALYAAYLNAALKKRSGGLRSLDDIVRGLYEAARRDGQPRQPASLFRDRVVGELGPEGGEDFDRLIARASSPVEPPSDAFGPCFRRADRKEPMFDLGFDPESLRGEPVLIRGLKKGSAAERAGLREGDLALRVEVPEPAAALAKKGKGRDVVMTVSGRRGGKKIRYRPIGERTVMRWEAKRCER